MRAIWSSLIIISSVSALSTSKYAEDISQQLLNTNNTDSQLSSQCSHFVKSCLENCEQQTINNFSSTCSSRNATCTCNNVDITSKVFTTLLKGVPEAPAADKKKLQVENSKEQLGMKDSLRPVQYNAVLGEADQSTLEQSESQVLEEEEEEMYDTFEEPMPVTVREFQHMEYIYPNPRLARNTVFQEKYCTHFLIRCKQDCPAAFSSYSCDANNDQTGFLLACVCNSVDIAASVDAQVQAEM